MKNGKRFGITGTILVCSLITLISGCKRSDDLAGTSSSNQTTAGIKFDDTIVTSKVKSALLTDPEIKSSDIKVETNKGEVMLSGFVDNQLQIDHSVAVAKSVDGVKNVNNMLALKSGSTTVGSTVDDSVVTTKVKAALLSANVLQNMDISVETDKGEVQLSGFVDNDKQLARAVEIAQAVDGVKSVKSNLSIKK